MCARSYNQLLHLKRCRSRDRNPVLVSLPFWPEPGVRRARRYRPEQNSSRSGAPFASYAPFSLRNPAPCPAPPLIRIHATALRPSPSLMVFRRACSPKCVTLTPPQQPQVTQSRTPTHRARSASHPSACAPLTLTTSDAPSPAAPKPTRRAAAATRLARSRRHLTAWPVQLPHSRPAPQQRALPGHP